MFFFIREMNEPVMVNQAKLFPSNYTNRVVHLFTALLQSMLIHVKINLYFWSCSYCKQPLLWPLLRKKLIPLYTFLKFSTYLEVNSARSIQNTFYKCSRALNLLFLKQLHFFSASSDHRLICFQFCIEFKQQSSQW